MPASNTATDPPRFAAVVFDLDGLLLDSERPIQDAWIEVCSRRGIAFDAQTYRGAVGLDARDARAYLSSVLGAHLSFDAGIAEVRSILDRTHPDSTFALMPGAAELLSFLQRTAVPCAVASSSNLAEVDRRLRQAGVRERFAAIAGGDEVRQGKPAPDVYLLARERLGPDPQAAVLAFEDSEPGARAGLAAGLSVVLVPGLRPPATEIRHQCLAVLPTLEAALVRARDWFARP